MNKFGAGDCKKARIALAAEREQCEEGDHQDDAAAEGDDQLATAADGDSLGAGERGSLRRRFGRFRFRRGRFLRRVGDAWRRLVAEAISPRDGRLRV
jgi:hypothetical protein